MDLRTEKDIERLRATALLLDDEVRRLLQVIKLKTDELDMLKGTTGSLQESLNLLETLRKRADAAKGRDPKKRGDETPEPKRRPKNPGHGPNPQKALRRETVLYEHDEADRTCPCCGGRLEPMPDQYEVSEMVDVVDIEYRVVEVRRQKYVCACGGTVETAPGPERAIEGGRYSLPFAVQVGDDKYDFHSPLERQVKAMAQHGLQVSRNTLWDQIFALTPDLRPAYHALKHHILAKDVLGLDQTGWPCLNGKRTKPWQMWCLTSEDAVFHAIRDDKSAATFVDLLGPYKGVIVCDALSTHGAAARGSASYTLAHCFAHVIRRFKEAIVDFEIAGVPLAFIGRLYDIEEKAENEEHRRALRRTESKPIMDELWAWLTNTSSIRSTSLGRAIRYTVGIWPGLTVFLHNPRVWLDNNRCERGIRGPVLGRKNHYGSKSRRGTEVASIFYSLIETAKLHGVPSKPYLLEAVRAGRRGEILLPWQMAG